MNSYKKFYIIFGIFITLSFMAFYSQQSSNADNSATKQLAGPPEEILAGAMVLPQPQEAAIHSRTAMIPVHLEQTRSGSWNWQGELLVDNPEELTLLVLSPEKADWDINIQMPSQKSAQSLNDATKSGNVAVEEAWLGIEAAGYPGKAFRFNEAEAGRWQVTIAARNSGSDAKKPAGYLVLASKKSPYKLLSHLTTYNLVLGNQVGFATYLYADEDNMTDDHSTQPSALKETIQKASIRFITPSGAEIVLPMQDDGQQADGNAGDGIFGGLIEATETGQYTAQITVQGITAEGTPFLRTSEHIFPIVEPIYSLNNQPASTYQKDDVRLGINLPLNTKAETLEMVQVRAEVWGTSQDGQAIPVAWIGGMVEPTQTKTGLALPLTLDARWIGRAQAQAPFELRNITIQDRQTHIPLAQLDVAKMDVDKLPDVAFQKGHDITDEMLTGPKPEWVNKGNRSGGNKLMLVHGYCSPGVWQGIHFSDYQVFYDFTQNRSHDEFAQLIKQQGSNLDSFGIVGHSQGGAASLHLHTYYWSPLENATGGRLIQSVGTPYQGTALAGNLALLGEIFDVGCGTNWDMTYDGAALWLSGIPNSARDDVHFYTTSFTDKWWRYDYCNVATDLFLTDPDDGVIEKWSGQLSGANNMGHTQGQCHVFFMRDPAQTYDANRNAQMNSAASR